MRPKISSIGSRVTLMKLLIGAKSENLKAFVRVDGAQTANSQKVPILQMRKHFPILHVESLEARAQLTTPEIKLYL